VLARAAAGHNVPVALVALKVLLAPALVALATLVARRHGPALGGWVSALPVIAGPVLLVFVVEHGEDFAQRAARGTLMGLVALSAFIVAYAHIARQRSVLPSLAAGWLAFFAATVAIAGWDPSAAIATTSAAGALGLAWLLTRGDSPTRSTTAAVDASIVSRVVLTAALVLALSAASGALGPRLGGILAAFPVLASLLAGLTHADHGGVAAGDLLHGMVAGLTGFATFCVVIAVALEPLGTPAAFALGVLASLAAHATTLPFVMRRPAVAV
jgi:hypothetical protein